MKADLDYWMEAHGLDALLINGAARHNPPMYYLAGGVHLSSATLIKKRGETARLFHQDMEREEAAKTGLPCIPYSAYSWRELLAQAQGDTALATALRLQRMLTDVGVAGGRLGVYGHADISSLWATLTHLSRLMPQIVVVGETAEDSVFLHAMETKDESEVARIRRMGQVTTTVVQRVADYLTTRPVNSEEVLLREDGQPLTVGDVKARINLWLAELGAENPEGTIFAIGREAGIPHSSGSETEALRLGSPIVFDLFPCEAGGGYFYDFTRTWCLGYAPPAARQLYDAVRTVFETILTRVRPGLPFPELHRLACERFEALGHPSPLHTDAPRTGYVHSLGHGLGLNVHERPWSSLTAAADNHLRPGVVITIEPGLYYPEAGLGVRIEDTFWIRPDGGLERLAEYPYDFVLEMRR